MRKIFALFIAAALALLATGCANLQYYAESIGGQFAIWSHEQPIEAVLADPDADAALKRKLQSVLEIRRFATQELRLPDNGSYRSYADLRRPYVVWNVFAAREFSLEPKKWCFNFVGCVSYRGYFSKDKAEKFARALRDNGYDIYVGGVSAYSTLGWFADPILNTLINKSDTDLAAVIFHELAHQVVYVAGDSAFNESFATAVEIEGLRRWLTHKGSAQQREVSARSRTRHNAFVALLSRYRAELETLYESDRPKDEKRLEKARLFAAMREEYQALKSDWGGYEGYDRWFEHANNAALASVATYTDFVPAFQQLLAQERSDLRRFYAQAARLAKKPEDMRTALLEALTAEAKAQAMATAAAP